MPHSLPGKPTLAHPHSEKCFLMFRRNLLCCILCTLPLVSAREETSLCCLCSLSSGVLCTLMRSHGVFSSSSSTVSALSTSLCRQDAPVLSSTLWTFPISSCPCCPQEHWSEQRTPWAVPPVLSRGERSPPLTQGQCSSYFSPGCTSYTFGI